MQSKQMWITFGAGLVYVVAAMWIMIYAGMNRVITIQDVGQEQIFGTNLQGVKEEGGTWKSLPLNEEVLEQKDIVVPLEAEIKAENVVLENHYMDKEIWIGLDGIEKNYFEKNEVSANPKIVEKAVYGKQDGLLWLRFKMDDIYECQSILEDGHLCISLAKPKEIYETIVVVDPCYETAGGIQTEGMTAKEITTDIARRLEERLRTEEKYKVYYTDMEGKNPSIERRQELLKETEADLYIGISLNDSDDRSVYGVETIYNGTYFIPVFGNVELADCLTRNVTEQISGRANGLTKAGEEDILVKEATIPAVILKAGYLSNTEEAALLNMEDYREKIAEGIFLTVQEAGEMLNQAE